MARSGLEVDAQKEAAKFLNTIGWAYKMSVEMRCMVCGKMSYPTHTGAFDYIASVRSEYEPITIGVEIKATPNDRWPLSSWSAEQRTWSGAWEARTGGNSYIWLQYQTGRVDAKDINSRRRVWLVPRNVVLKAEIAVLSSGVKSLPMAAHSRTKGRDDMNQELTAETLFDGYEMTWLSGGWWPKNNALWSSVGTYATPEGAKKFAASHPHPDKAVSNLNS